MLSTFRRLECEEAQTAAEYAVVLGVITLGIVTAYGALSGTIQSLFETTVSFFS